MNIEYLLTLNNSHVGGKDVRIELYTFYAVFLKNFYSDVWPRIPVQDIKDIVLCFH